MKKIFLIILSFFILTQSLNANRDSVEEVEYRATIGGDIKVTFKTENTACSVNNMKTYEGSIKNLLNTSDNDCNFSNGFLICNTIYTSNFNEPSNSITKDVKLYGKYSDILRGVGVPEKIYLNNSDILTLVNPIELSLVTDVFGNSSKRKGTEKNFSINKDLGTFSYFDNSECQSRTCKTNFEIEDIKKDNEKILSKISDSKEKEKKKKELDDKFSEIEECKIEIMDSICEKDESGKCSKYTGQTITTGIEPGVLKYFSIHKRLLDNKTCIKEGNDFYCYASEKLDFSFGVESQGDGMNKVITSINNSDNTAPAFDDNNTRLTLNNNSSFEVGKTYKGSLKSNLTFPKKSGTYTIVLQGIKDDNPAYGTNLLSFKLTIVPNPNGLKGELISSVKDVTTSGEVYANAKDSYETKFKISDKFGNEIKDKRFRDMVCKNCIKSKNNLEGVWVYKSSSVDGYSMEYFSRVPNEEGNKKMTFEGKIHTWNQKGELVNCRRSGWFSSICDTTSFNLYGGEKIFKEPLSYESISVEGGIINVSKDQKYTIKLKNEGNLSDFKNSKISLLSSDNLEFTSGSEKFTNTFSAPNNNLNNNLEANFIAKAIANKNEKILGAITLTPKNLKVSYNLDSYSNSYEVEYELNNLGKIEGTCEVNTTGLIINGKSQSKGKEGYTSELNTFSNISKPELKRIIDKNAKDFTRGLTSGQKVNGVLYYEGDQTYSEIKRKLTGIDSLVIKNGNLFINENVTGNIGIVVLTDKFIANPSSSKGNIFVKNTVSKIEAYLYADGGLISASDLKGTKYTDEELREEKLDLVGSLVSSNTVGGSEKGETSCFLPGNKKTNDCSLAERYDLNYIRKHIIQCDAGLNDTQKAQNYSFKVTYNPAIQTKSPKVFLNK